MVKIYQRPQHAEFQGEDRCLCIPVAFRKLPRTSQFTSICPSVPSSSGVLSFFLLSFFPFLLSFIQRTEAQPLGSAVHLQALSGWWSCPYFTTWSQLSRHPVCLVSLIKLRVPQARAAPPQY